MADAKITQLSAILLTDNVSCVTKWTQCWSITRADGEVYAFTSLDQNIVFRGVTYKACDSLSATATEMASNAGSTGSMELNGIISDTSITETDLAGGLFDGAEIEAWMVPWENSGGEIPFMLLRGTMGDVKRGTIQFSAEIITDGAVMQQKPLLDTYTPGCPYKLGDSRCTFDLDSLEISGSVTALTVPTSPNSSDKRVFLDSTRTEDDGYFEFGEITWTTGDNAGLSSEVKDFNGTTFVLWDPMINPIQIGDAYTAKPGCNKAKSTCKTKFNNLINFGGFPDVPGEDKLYKSPDAK